MYLKTWGVVENWLTGAFALTALATALFEMTVRVAMPSLTSDGPEEIVVYLIVWALFISASSLAADNRHVRADVLLHLFSIQGKRIAESISALVGLLFAVTLLYYGYLAALEAWELDERSVSMLRLPLWIYYTCLPFGCLLLLTRYSIRLISLSFYFTPALVINQDMIMPMLDNEEREQ